MATTSSKNYTIFTSFPKVLASGLFHPLILSQTQVKPAPAPFTPLPPQTRASQSALPSAVPAVQALVLLGCSEQSRAVLGGWARSHCICLLSSQQDY